jgi:hypothetical protein
MTEKRPRKHRRVEPWVDAETRRPVPLSDREWAEQARVAPVLRLAEVLAQDPPFLEAIERLRTGDVTADQLARRYVRREGRPRRVMRHVFEFVADSDSESPQMRLYRLVDPWRSEPLTPDPKQWRHAKRFREAAARLACRGSGRCLDCGAKLATDRGREGYCASHESVTHTYERAHREAILALLNTVGDALGVR